MVSFVLRPEHLDSGWSAVMLAATAASTEVPSGLPHQGRLAVGEVLFAAPVPDGCVTAANLAPGTHDGLTTQAQPAWLFHRKP